MGVAPGLQRILPVRWSRSHGLGDMGHAAGPQVGRFRDCEAATMNRADLARVGSKVCLLLSVSASSNCELQVLSTFEPDIDPEAAVH